MSYDDAEQDWQDELDEFNDEQIELLPCPSCKEMIYEESERCPKCGEWIMPQAAHAGKLSPLWIAAALLALLGMLFWIVF